MYIPLAGVLVGVEQIGLMIKWAAKSIFFPLNCGVQPIFHRPDPFIDLVVESSSQGYITLSLPPQKGQSKTMDGWRENDHVQCSVW